MIARTDPGQSALRAPLAELTLTGPDAASFLQGYLTCDTQTLEEGVGTPMAYCNIKGRVLANGWARGGPDRVALIVHPTVADALSTHLSRYLAFARSKLEPAPSNLGLRSEAAHEGIELLPFRWRAVPEPNPAPAADLDRLCIEAGVALVSAPVSERFLPQMLGLTDIGAVSFDKGCYLGQEVVARAQYRGEVKRRIRRFRYRGTLPAPGTATVPSGVVVHAAAVADDAGDALVVTGVQDTVLAGPDCEFSPTHGTTNY